MREMGALEVERGEPREKNRELPFGLAVPVPVGTVQGSQDFFFFLSQFFCFVLDVRISFKKLQRFGPQLSL